jgi:imidazolonepropionase-like amidohydrolase
MYYKTESYIGSEYAGKILWENGLVPVYVSDNPVLNAQHVLFEAAKGYKYGLPYHAALASVTTAPADLLGLGKRLGKIKPGFDADIVVWDSDPLSVGATPVQVWIDGTAQFKDPVELEKPSSLPIVPDEKLKATLEPSKMADILFTGVTSVLLSSAETAFGTEKGNFNVAISNGRISCVGPCRQEIEEASTSGKKIINLENGYLTESFTAFGSTLGLNEIDAEVDTDNGEDRKIFSRGVDGLLLENKKLAVAGQYGVTKAISAPKFSGSGTHHGTSVGFLTGARNAAERGAIWADDVAVHYTLSLEAKDASTPSISSAIGSLRTALLEAARAKENPTNPFSEAAYLQKVISGDLPLAITVHSADAIAAVLKVKSDVEYAIKASSSTASKLRLVIIGGAESHIVAGELAKAGVGVVLAPLQSYSLHWDQRRSLSGAPLTNGTVVDLLVDAGVTTAIGLEEDWLIRDLALLAGIAYRNGGGRLGEKSALDLVSSNVYKMLGLESPSAHGEEDGMGHFIVFEGSPLEINHRIRAVGSGSQKVTVFE